jgi:hypothetical protein
MASYYEQLASLRAALADAGAPDVAEELRQAERGGTTSSEILNDTGVILHRLMESGEADRLGLRGEIARLDDLGRELFDSTNRKF